MSDAPTADRVALRYLAEAYAAACDARDGDALLRCFTDDATIVIHRPGAADRHIDHGSLGRIPGALARYDRTMHFVGNHRADVDGDQATGETVCLAHHLTGTNDHIMAIRYQDRYRRMADGWRIASRELFVQWTQDTVVDPSGTGG